MAARYSASLKKSTTVAIARSSSVNSIGEQPAHFVPTFAGSL